MKRSELIIGNAYYLSKYNDWEGKVYGRYPNLSKCAISNRSKKVILVETQLKTEYDRKYRTRDVLVRNIEGKEIWVPLAHLRGDFGSCIKTLFEYKKEIDNRDSKHRQHLERKHQREVYRPALKTMLTMLKEIEGGYISDYDRIESAFSIEQLNAIIEGLSLLKTEKPALVAVAS